MQENNSFEILFEAVSERDYLDNISTDGKVVLKRI
jgi:hypothetical protein